MIAGRTVNRGKVECRGYTGESSEEQDGHDGAVSYLGGGLPGGRGGAACRVWRGRRGVGDARCGALPDRRAVARGCALPDRLLPTPTPGPPSDTPAPVEARPLAPVELEPAFPGIEFDRMVFLTYAEDESGRLFVVLQPGRIVVFENDPGVRVGADVPGHPRAQVNDAGNEEGLLGLAFDPAFVENGHFYVYYTASRPRRIGRLALLGQRGRPRPGGPRLGARLHGGGAALPQPQRRPRRVWARTGCCTSASATEGRAATRGATGRIRPRCWAASCAST